MAAAQMVLYFDPTHLNWLQIEDDHGDVWRYGKRGSVDMDTPAHVEGQFSKDDSVRAVLLPRTGNTPVLRQDGPGLPQILVVDYVQVGTGPGTPPTTSGGKYEYEQEPSPDSHVQ